MNRMWAPWRKAYIRPSGRKARGCLFCRLARQTADVRHYVLKRTRLGFAVLNLYPYSNGHVLVVPKRHVSELSELSDDERLECLGLAEEIMAGLRRALKPHGFNMGMNLGRVGGAGIPGHLHLHIVPRWLGDVNFMPVTAGVKVISESLDSVYATLAKQLGRKKGRLRKK